MDSNDIAIIMCAGKGTRMKSTLPKVLHEINGISMITRVIHNVIIANINAVVIMVGENGNEIKEHITRCFPSDSYPINFIFIEQTNPQGTGHCIQCAMPMIESKCSSQYNRIVILSGDMPFISSETILSLLEYRNAMLIAEKVNPFGFGRIILKNEGVFKIIEEKDCTDEEKTNKLVNCGAYCFTYSMLSNSIFKINNDNANHEYYLPDVVNHKNCFITPLLLKVDNSYEAIGVNTQEDLQIAIEKDIYYNLSSKFSTKV